MKDKKLMNSKDKKNYLIYKLQVNLFRSLLGVLFATVIIYFIQSVILGINFIICFVAVMIIYLFFNKTFKILFSRNVYIIDGHIFKKHVFIKNSGSSDNDSGPYPCARAISEDNSISTSWIYFPNRYFGIKNIRVKIVIKKNKAIDFYVVEK